MPRIYDCFTFYNELDLLEIRLHELDPVVDGFVLCEAPITFRGRPKPLHFAENRDRFAPFLHKIAHVVVDDMPGGPDEEATYWKREKTQRNATRRGLGKASPDDLVLLSDLDEIPRASAVEAVARGFDKPTVYCFDMTDRRYFANLRRPVRWIDARLARLGDIRTMERLRGGGPTWRPKHPRVLHTLRQWKRMSFGMRRLRPWVVVSDGGWHLSAMNGPDAVSEKYHAYSHVRPESESSPTAIAERIRRALRYASEPIEAGVRHFELCAELPSHLDANRSRFAHLIADRQTFERFGVAPPDELSSEPG